MKRTSNTLFGIAAIAAGILIIASVCCVAAAVVLEARRVYPKPEMKSTFLQTYDPNVFVRPFVSPRWIQDSVVTDGAGARDGFATFEKNFEASFVMCSAEQQTLMRILTQSIVATLRGSGARIANETGNDADGYHFAYIQGKSTGTIVLRPVKQLDLNHLGGEHGTGPKKESSAS